MKSFDISRRNKKIAARLPARQAKPQSVKPKQTKSVKWMKPVAGLMVLVVLALAAGYVFLPEATIQVTARSEPVTRDLSIRVDKNLAASAADDLAVPGKFIEIEVTGKKTAASTGSKNVGKKASGFVLIYNFSKTTLILKAPTTVLTSGGRKYFFTQDVGGIRPTARIGLEDEEVDPTSLIAPVPLAAEGPGEEYNLQAGTRLEIENEAFGSQPKLLYAIVVEDISGGSTKQLPVVAQSDIDNSYDLLFKEIVEKTRTEMVEQNPGFKILDNALAADTVEKQTSAQAGDEAAEFQSTMKLKVRILAFDETEILELVTQRIKRLLPETKILITEGERIQSQFANVNLDNGTGILVTHFEGQIFYRLDEAELLEKVKGKTVDEIREILLSQPEINSIEIELAPFWVKRAPKLKGKTKIEVLTYQ